jgi:MerR family transcriptional regulator/heat shock protein HspR
MSTMSTLPEHLRRVVDREDTVTVAPVPAPASNQVGLDKPIYTISVAAEILETHPRTLMMYEHLGLVVPHRTATNRRRYSQRDILTLQAIQRLTRHHGLNLNGARYVIQCLQLMDANKVSRPDYLADIDVTHVKL